MQGNAQEPLNGTQEKNNMCHQIYDIIRTSLGNKIVDHCSNNVFILYVTLGSNRLRKNNWNNETRNI